MRKGSYHTEETKQKQREAHKGENNPFFDKCHSEESKQKMREAKKGEKNFFYGKHFIPWIKGKHHSEETKRKMREARKHRVFPNQHTKPELIFEEICKKHNLPFKYVGDGQFWIERINPDFVECNGKKIAVEVFGDYWHSPLLNSRLKENRTLSYRKKLLTKYGWMLVVFWDRDLLREDAEAFVLSELKKI